MPNVFNAVKSERETCGAQGFRRTHAVVEEKKLTTIVGKFRGGALQRLQ